MQKALTKEDLIYILNGIFKLSKEDGNALEMKGSGMFVPDYKPDLEKHTKNNNIHITFEKNSILDKITVSGNNILYDDNILCTVSSETNNAIKQKSDGIFVSDTETQLTEHINNDEIHVTKEEKDRFANLFEHSKKYVKELIGELTIYNYEVVQNLPVGNISTSTCYIYVGDANKPEEVIGVPYIYYGNKWNKLSITKETIDKIINDIEKTYLKKTESHTHSNKDVLDKITESPDGYISYNGTELRRLVPILENSPKNAIKYNDRGELFVRDLSQEIDSIIAGGTGLVKVNLYMEECDHEGIYILKDTIDRFSFVMIDYYYKANKADELSGCAKSVLIDVDTLNYLRSKSIDYMLEFGYGISNCTSKINFEKDKLRINYYHGVCIYKITGIGKAG